MPVRSDKRSSTRRQAAQVGAAQVGAAQADTAQADTAQVDTALAMSEHERFLRSVLASSGDCLKVLDLDGRLVFMNEGGQRLMEVSDFNAIQGCPWPDFWVADKNLEARAAVAAARAGGSGAFQGVGNTMAGTPRWWDVQVTPISGADGRPEKLLVVSRDITGLKRAEEQQRLLVQEMAHRVKNTLAMVQAIASRTLRGDASLADLRQAFTARLMALAQAHDVLLQGSWTEASLRSLVDNAIRLLGHDEPGRFEVEGEDVTLGPRAALSLALVLHELGTNAVKYGALSVPAGRLAVRWRRDIADGEPWLHLHWRETGGPLVQAPGHQGFGSRLIERSLTQGMGATVRLDYEASGVCFAMSAPLAGLQGG